MTTAWVDSHCHVHGSDDADEQLARARAAGVVRLVCIGTDAATSRAALALAAAHTDVQATVGLHPHDAVRFEAEWPVLQELAADPGCAGVGEAGFDLYYEHSPVADQETAFRAQIELATRLGKALVIHSRDAWDATFTTLRAAGVPERTVFHCFTGGPDEARIALDLGCFISFSGIVTFKTADDAARSRRARPRRPVAGRDRLALSRAGAVPRQAERARAGAGGGCGGGCRRGVEPEVVAAVTAANAAIVFG